MRRLACANAKSATAKAVGDQGGAALGTGLSQKPLIEDLGMYGLGLGAEAGQALAQVLPGMIGLRELRLFSNNLDQSAAEARFACRFSNQHSVATSVCVCGRAPETEERK